MHGEKPARVATSANGLPDDLARRTVPMPGVLNLRHLGGLPTSNGFPTAATLLRSGNPDGIDTHGWQLLVDSFGVRAVVDLRSSHERAELDHQDQPRPVPIIHAPIIEAATRQDYTPKMTIPHTGDPHMVAMAKRLLEVGGAGFVGAATAIADHAPVLVHCSAGKDRTGVLTALVLRIAGVADDVIAADYAASIDLIGDQILELRNQISALDDPDSDIGIRTFSTPEDAWKDREPTREVMDAILGHLDATWQGAEGYLTTHGMGQDAIARLRERLTGAAT